MILNEYWEYVKNPLAVERAQVVVVPPGESWTALRRFYQDRGDVELRLSDLVQEGSWLPMPDEIFKRVRHAIIAHNELGSNIVLLGVSGYLALLTKDNRHAVITALRKMLDDSLYCKALFLLRSDDCTVSLLNSVFANPRYRQARQLIEIENDPVIQYAIFCDNETVDNSTEVMLVGDNLIHLIPEACDTFKKYLRYIEEHPFDYTVRRIVVASEGRELAGLNSDVRQVVNIRDFAHVFYGVNDEMLSENTLLWICEQGLIAPENSLFEALKSHFFSQGDVEKNVLHVFNKQDKSKREPLLWILKQIARKGSYLEYIVNQKNIEANNFRTAYVVCAVNCLNNAESFALERRDAILNADVRLSGADIGIFIEQCLGESISRVAPWLNCKTDIERAELLRRCADDGVVFMAINDVYPEVKAYLSSEFVFDDQFIEDYFREYRKLKLTCRVTAEFSEKAKIVENVRSVQKRDTILQQYLSDKGCALLVVDAMSVDWIPMLVALAQQRNIGIEFVSVGEAHLPTSTRFNYVQWPDSHRRLLDIKRFDNIAHNGAEAHESRRPEENLAAALGVIGSEVLPRVEQGLVQFDRVCLTADHGSSRLAVLAWQNMPKLAQTLSCEFGAELADWRYREPPAKGVCPPELEETLDGSYWVVRGYNRLPKKGGGQGFEVHGGATLEERLVPIILFSKTGQFVPSAMTGKRAQIIEKDDFDL
jgi:hypothetical protein